MESDSKLVPVHSEMSVGVKSRSVLCQSFFYSRRDKCLLLQYRVPVDHKTSSVSRPTSDPDTRRDITVESFGDCVWTGVRRRNRSGLRIFIPCREVDPVKICPGHHRYVFPRIHSQMYISNHPECKTGLRSSLKDLILTNFTLVRVVTIFETW